MIDARLPYWCMGIRATSYLCSPHYHHCAVGCVLYAAACTVMRACAEYSVRRAVFSEWVINYPIMWWITWVIFLLIDYSLQKKWLMVTCSFLLLSFGAAQSTPHPPAPSPHHSIPPFCRVRACARGQFDERICAPRHSDDTYGIQHLRRVQCMSLCDVCTEPQLVRHTAHVSIWSTSSTVYKSCAISMFMCAEFERVIWALINWFSALHTIESDERQK